MNTSRSIAVPLIVATLGAGNIGAAALGQPNFVQFDSDRDGALSEQEFTQARAERMAQRAAQGYRMRHAAYAPDFAALDLNADGIIGVDEFLQHQSSRQRMGYGTPWRHCRWR